MLKIWQRYFLKELLNNFLFILFSFYFLYAVLDYSTHAKEISSATSPGFFSFVLYYVALFIGRLDILAPIALLVSLLKVLLGSSQKGEIVALNSSGLSLYTFFKPFFFFTLSLSLFLLIINTQILSPLALRQIEKFEKVQLHAARKERPISSIKLRDGSTLVYRTFDRAGKELHDVVWIRAPKDFLIMRTLLLKDSIPKGLYVDHLEERENVLTKTESFTELLFPDLVFGKGEKSLRPVENLSPLQLYKYLKEKSPKYRASEVEAHLVYKLLFPFVSLLILLALFPSSTAFRRNIPFLSFYALSITGLITFFMVADGALILAESGRFMPFIVIVLPFLMLGLPTCFYFRRRLL